MQHLYLSRVAKLFIHGILILLSSRVCAQGDTINSPSHKTSVKQENITRLPTYTYERFSIHFQTTYIYQYKPRFDAAYSGSNSLQPEEEKQNSLTATLYLGARLWKGAELYLNPELAGGSGLSGAFGLGASSNGETFRVGDPAPTLYLARLYLCQTFAIGKHGDNDVAGGPNALMGHEPANYLRFYIGKLSLGDLFDNNDYANSPRTQFMNWCLMNNGAWDYAANVRGYTYAFVPVLHSGNMTYKLAFASLPKTANGADLNTDPGEAYALNAEVERTYKLHGKEGSLKLLAFHNQGIMGRYTDALQNSMAPDVTAVRASGHSKTGFGINLGQQLGKYTGIFARAGWNDGATETWVFTETDLSLSTGINMSGDRWKRKHDFAGLAIAVNGLSKDHREYLARGGLGFQLGDGKLQYANETALELFYNYMLTQQIWFSADYQFIANPGFNSDRGPVNVYSIRFHAEL